MKRQFSPDFQSSTKRYDMAPTQEISEGMVEEVLEDDLESQCIEALEGQAQRWFPTPPPPPKDA